MRSFIPGLGGEDPVETPTDPAQSSIGDTIYDYSHMALSVYVRIFVVLTLAKFATSKLFDEQTKPASGRDKANNNKQSQDHNTPYHYLTNALYALAFGSIIQNPDLYIITIYQPEKQYSDSSITNS